MAGTVEGGRQAAKTNKDRHGADFYARIGAKGGRNGKTGGFHHAEHYCDDIQGLHKVARCAGFKGGVKSRRTKNPNND